MFYQCCLLTLCISTLLIGQCQGCLEVSQDQLDQFEASFPESVSLSSHSIKMRGRAADLSFSRQYLLLSFKTGSQFTARVYVTPKGRFVLYDGTKRLKKIGYVNLNTVADSWEVEIGCSSSTDCWLYSNEQNVTLPLEKLPDFMSTNLIRVNRETSQYVQIDSVMFCPLYDEITTTEVPVLQTTESSKYVTTAENESTDDDSESTLPNGDDDDDHGGEESGDDLESTDEDDDSQSTDEDEDSESTDEDDNSTSTDEDDESESTDENDDSASRDEDDDSESTDEDEDLESADEDDDSEPTDEDNDSESTDEDDGSESTDEDEDSESTDEDDDSGSTDEDDDSQSTDAENESFITPEPNEVENNKQNCLFLNQSPSNLDRLTFPNDLKFSDISILTIKCRTTPTTRSWLFYLIGSKAQWMFCFYPEDTYGVLKTFQPLSVLTLQERDSQEMKLQVFHNKSSGDFHILAPLDRTEIIPGDYDLMDINILDKKYQDFEYFSICREAQDPEIELIMDPPTPILSSPLLLECTITGPPFLSGYWQKDGVPIVSNRYITVHDPVINETEPMHKVTLRLEMRSFSAVYNPGTYSCQANSTTSSNTITKVKEIQYTETLNITYPFSDSYNNLPKTFEWEVAGWPLDPSLQCDRGIDVERRWEKRQSTNGGYPYAKVLSATVSSAMPSFICRFKSSPDGETQSFTFQECGDDKFIKLGKCMNCPKTMMSNSSTNFTCIEKTEETPDEIPEETSDKTPEETSDETPEETPEETPDETSLTESPTDEPKHLSERDSTTLPIIQIAIGGAASFFLLVTITTIFLFHRRSLKRKRKQEAEEERAERRRTLTVSAPVLHYHVSGGVGEVTYSQGDQEKEEEPVYSVVDKPRKPTVTKPPKPTKSTFYGDPIYANTGDDEEEGEEEVSPSSPPPSPPSPPPTLGETPQTPQSIWNDFSEDELDAEEKEIGEEEEESAYAELEFLGRKREEVKGEEAVEKEEVTYATVSKFQKIEPDAIYTDV